MGLFDWLNEGMMGGGMGGSSMPPTPQPDNLPTGPMPPPQGLDLGGGTAAATRMGLGAEGSPMTPAEGNRIYDDYKKAGGGGPVNIQGSPENPLGNSPPPMPPMGQQRQPFVDATNSYAGPGGNVQPGQPAPPPPPAGGPGLPPNMPYPPGSDPMTAGGAPGNGPGLPPGMPVPTPQARPTMPPPPTATTPVNAAPTEGKVPGPPMPLGPGLGVATPAELQGNPQAQSIIGRALGLDRNREASLRGSLASGLKSVGENYTKPGLAALSGSAGSAIEGGKAADDKTTEQQDKFLGRKLAANAADNTALNGKSTRDLNMARTQLALEQAKQTMAGGGETGINTASSKYLTAVQRTNSDPRLALLRDQVRAGTAGNDATAQTKQMDDLRSKILSEHLESLGLSAKDATKIGKQPGMSANNPIKTKGMTQDKLDALPVGAYIIAPDGRVLVKQPPKGDAAGANPQAAAQPQQTTAPPPAAGAAPPPPVPVTTPAGSRADTADDEE